MSDRLPRRLRAAVDRCCWHRWEVVEWHGDFSPETYLRCVKCGGTTT